MNGDAGAACAGVTEPLWDAALAGEHEVDRVARHTRAMAYCRRCPVRRACAADVDVWHDDGIRAGVVLPTIHDSQRRSVQSYRPGRGGVAAVLQKTS